MATQTCNARVTATSGTRLPNVVETISLVTPGQSLGARLAEQNQERELEHLTPAQMSSPEALERARRHKAAIRAAFDGVKVQIECAIEAAEPLLPIRLPPVFDFNDSPHGLIDNPRHNDNHLYVEFTRWLTANELCGKLRQQEDGGGVSSWHMLTITPAVAA